MNFAIKVRAGTTGTTGTTERIFDTLFRCGLFRLYGLCGLRKNLTKRETPISCQKGLDLALTRKLADGTYYAYFPFASLTEESKMTPYHKKFKKLMDEVLQRLHNISRVKNHSLCLGKNIEEEHISR